MTAVTPAGRSLGVGELSFPALPAAIDTPRVVLDLARLDANIARLQGELDRRSVALRPHAKTHKSIDVARRQLAAGARGITVGTLGEAEVFAGAGIRDLFLASEFPGDIADAIREKLARPRTYVVRWRD